MRLPDAANVNSMPYGKKTEFPTRMTRPNVVEEEEEDFA